MPTVHTKGKKAMLHNDGAHLPITTGSALVIYGWTLQEFVLLLWAAYVVILIVTKLPEFTRAVVRIAGGLVAAWEGRSLVAYADPVGVPTICEGYTHGVRLGDMATPAQCDALTEQEVRRALAVVDGSTPGQLPDGVRVALASFVYNVGSGAYGGSTLLRRLRAGDLKAACNELPRWVYAGGKKLRGLERRREAERQICLSSLR